jgi:FkbM family methyltransferase
MNIRDWIETTFNNNEPKLFLELGASNGSDTTWLAQISNVIIHAFEPDDIRNNFPILPNVILHHQAIGNFDGPCKFFPSDERILLPHNSKMSWPYSSSIRKPKNHLHYFPDVIFGTPTIVESIRLDTVYQQQKLDIIDFIWADVQGAEVDVIQGGMKALTNTKYLYTEYYNNEMYEGQIDLKQILELLPDYKILEQWESDVLLMNKNLAI